MGRILFLGGGVVGMCAATMLANDGHQVTVLERDPNPPPSPDAAWDGWDRRGVNQFKMLHFLLPRFLQVADAELPGLTDAMVNAGALRMNPLTGIPDEISGGWREGDERFNSVTARRPVTESVVDRALTTQAILDQEAALIDWVDRRLAFDGIDQPEAVTAAAWT